MFDLSVNLTSVRVLGFSRTRTPAAVLGVACPPVLVVLPTLRVRAPLRRRSPSPIVVMVTGGIVGVLTVRNLTIRLVAVLWVLRVPGGGGDGGGGGGGRRRRCGREDFC